MKHTRRSFIRSAALGSAALSLAANLKAQNAPTIPPKGLSKRPRHPNLLFLWTDEHRGDTVPWAGNTALKAPNFFTPLGERSFVFHRAYCTQPVCTPSRGSILSGLWPHNHGAWTNNITFNPGVRTIAEHLPAVYTSGYYGKWHLGDELNAQRGFADWRSIEDYYRKEYTDPADLSRVSDYHHFLSDRGFPPDRSETDGTAIFSRTMAAAMPERYTKASFLAGEAEEFLYARSDGRPFLLHVNALEPHSPTYGPLNELHEPAAMPAGPSFARPPDGEIAGIARRRLESYPTEGYNNHPIDSENDWRRLRANYYGLVSLVDNAFARIIRALEASGQAENTIVVFTSDHGNMCGDHTLMEKTNFYEGSVHVPLAIHVPWLSRDRVDFCSPISLVDLVPTLLDLMGVDITQTLDGVSRAAALRSPSDWLAENITVEWNDGGEPAFSGRSRVTADGWKLNLYRDDNNELYDLNTDPGELCNLAHESTHRDRIRRLSDELLSWQQQTGDTLPLSI